MKESMEKAVASIAKHVKGRCQKCAKIGHNLNNSKKEAKTIPAIAKNLFLWIRYIKWLSAEYSFKNKGY